MKFELHQQLWSVEAAASDGTPTRTVSGVAVPYNVVANSMSGPVMFLPGSLPTDGKPPKLLTNHDRSAAVGLVTDRVDTPEAMLFTARISQTSAGNDALQLALDGVYDAVSVGITATDWTYDGQTAVIAKADWNELSLTPFPAFDGAQILDVAAEEPTPQPEEEDTTTASEEEPMPELIEAATPSSPIILNAATAVHTRPRITAAEAISGIICQRRDVLDVLATDQVLSDVTGLLPEPLIGDVWDTTFAGRPIIDAVGTRALPVAGETFYRRFVNQHTAVAQQNSEYNNLASEALLVQRLQFDKKTFGGYVNVSSQAGDWSEPALVQAILNDMIRMYAKATEAYVAGRIDNAAGAATTLITDPTDGDEVIASLYDTSAELRSATGELPTHIIVNSACWAKFGQAKDAGGNRIFPYLGPVNAAGMSAGAATFGMSPLGLSLIVSDDIAFAAGNYQALVLYAPAVEVYEDRSRTGGVRVENPATASATLGLWGYIAADVLPPVSGAGSYVKSLFAA